MKSEPYHYAPGNKKKKKNHRGRNLSSVSMVSEYWL